MSLDFLPRLLLDLPVFAIPTSPQGHPWPYVHVGHFQVGPFMLDPL